MSDECNHEWRFLGFIRIQDDPDIEAVPGKLMLCDLCNTHKIMELEDGEKPLEGVE